MTNYYGESSMVTCLGCSLNTWKEALGWVVLRLVVERGPSSSADEVGGEGNPPKLEPGTDRDTGEVATFTHNFLPDPCSSFSNRSVFFTLLH
ncbi:hypothetical protein CEXT_731441 [Caerostris extrusa]|uniref:Uncharacterized protein n=1 Tax=Caerostris extrusa TaxID=172846 RepID=A0AAV4SQP6_CAEEX|nr:hypothetical protein CEXT_731441 [Caerostris extrusa]